MTPAETAELFGVNVKTLARWAREEKIRFIKTLGGHHRYYRSDVMQMLNDEDAA